MKEGIHPTFYEDALVICACGNTWTTGSTKKEIHTDVCSNCHPFYTGEQRIVDTAGQVERFMKRVTAKDQLAAKAPAPAPTEQPPKPARERRPRVRGDMRSGMRGARPAAEEPAAPVSEGQAEAEARTPDTTFEVQPTETEAASAPPLATQEEAATQARIIEEQSPQMEAKILSQTAEPALEAAQPQRSRSRRSETEGGETARKPRPPRKPRAATATPAAATESGTAVPAEPSATSTAASDLAPLDVAGTSVAEQPVTEAAVDTNWSPSSDQLTGSGETGSISDPTETYGE